MLTRRSFIKYIVSAGAGAFLVGRLPADLAEAGELVPTQTMWLPRTSLDLIPGGTLDPLSVPKYMTPMLIPPVMPKAATIRKGGKPIDYYEIAVRQFQQQILPPGLPATTVWGYGPANGDGSRNALMLDNAPSLTIQAKAGRAVRVKWINELVDAQGNYLPHLLPVDQTLHWANPPGGMAGRDTRPSFESTPGPYTGPVPIVTHVHGAVGVGDESDGYPEAWYLPDAKNIPGDYA